MAILLLTGAQQVHTHTPVWRWVRIPPPQPCESSEATKREPNARGYNLATLFLGDINTGLALQVGEISDETVKYGREFCGTST
jgi:hypothetical protein